MICQLNYFEQYQFHCLVKVALSFIEIMNYISLELYIV